MRKNSDQICPQVCPHGFSKFATLKFATSLHTGSHLGKRLSNFAVIMPVDKPTAKIAKQKRVCFKFLDRFAYANLNCKAAYKFASSLQIWTSQVLRSTKIPLTSEFLLCAKNFKRLHTQLLGNLHQIITITSFSRNCGDGSPSTKSVACEILYISCHVYYRCFL